MKKSEMLLSVRSLVVKNSRGCHTGSGGFKIPHPAIKLPVVPDKQIIIEKLKTNVYRYMDVYEEFIGIKQVKEAHSRVIQAEMEFVKAQELRRTVHKNLNELQNKLRDIRSDLERTSRGEDRYLELIKQEIALVREERSVKIKFEEYESSERESFNTLSNALRLSHEKERAQNEKTKYWSVIGSVLGATVGIIGTSINSKLKIRQMKQVLTESSQESTLKIQSQILETLNQMNVTAVLTDRELDPKLSQANSAGDTINTDSKAKDLVTKSEALAASIETLHKRLDSYEKRSSFILVDSEQRNDVRFIVVSSALVATVLYFIFIGR